MFLADGSQDAHAEGVSYELCDVSRVGFLEQLAAMIFYGVTTQVGLSYSPMHNFPRCNQRE